MTLLTILGPFRGFLCLDFNFYKLTTTAATAELLSGIYFLGLL